jgi:hypothetical protein
MSLLALSLLVGMQLFAKDQSQTLDSTLSTDDIRKFSFSSSKWQLAEGKSAVVDTVRNHLPTSRMTFTSKQMPTGTASRAEVMPDGTVRPGAVTASWSTYRRLRDTDANPVLVWTELAPPYNQSQTSGMCWRVTGPAPEGRVGDSLEAFLLRDGREWLSCHSAVERDDKGGFVIRHTVRNHSANDASFGWGGHRGSLGAGKSQEYVVKSAAAPKESVLDCTETFQGDSSYSFRANAWNVP